MIGQAGALRPLLGLRASLSSPVLPRFSTGQRTASASASPPKPTDEPKRAPRPTEEPRRVPEPADDPQKATEHSDKSSADSPQGKPRSFGPALGLVGLLGAGGAFYYSQMYTVPHEDKRVAEVMKQSAKSSSPKDTVESAASTVEAALSIASSSSAAAPQTPPAVSPAPQSVESQAAPRPPPPPAENQAIKVLQQEVTSIAFKSAEADRLAGIEKRIAAKQALREAVDSQDPEKLSAALVSADEACLGECAESALARSLVASLVSRQSELLRGSAVSITAAEAEAAELANIADMTEDELRARVVELSRRVASERLHSKVCLADSLATQMEASELTSLQALDQALRRLKAEKDEQHAREYADLDASLEVHRDEVVAAARAKTTTDEQEKLNQDADQMQQVSDDIVSFVKSMHLDEVISMSSSLHSTQEALASEKFSVEHYNSCNGLAQAVLALEDAILAGRPCHRELDTLRAAAEKADATVVELLDKMPEECSALCRKGAVPSEETIRHRLPTELHEIAVSAFRPAGGGLAAELMARAFRCLYITTDEASGPSTGEGEAAKEVRSNLNAVSRLLRAKHVKAAGELENALSDLEGSLKGCCVDGAKDWLRDTRSALLLRQTIWIIKARVQCLTADFTCKSA